MSKGLEALNNIWGWVDGDVAEKCDKDFETIDKELNALEIIRTKRVDYVGVLVYAFKKDNGCDFYNSYAPKYYQLSQEEYDLLKEVLL